MSDDEFTPSGKWWTWPLWRRALAMATLRPYCMVRGELAVLRQRIALRFPNRPFHPVAWIHGLPCLDEWCGGHDELHHGIDDCHAQFRDHALVYEQQLDIPRSFADDFDLRVGRFYSWNRLEETE